MNVGGERKEKSIRTEEERKKKLKREEVSDERTI